MSSSNKYVANGGGNSSVYPPILTADEKEELGGYKFPFRNIACEGGGNKGMATMGAIRVLEELGYMEKVTRFAGASAGAMGASLLAVGYSSFEIEKFLRGDMESLFLDARFGVLSMLPNMLMNFGWHPGNRLFEFFGEKISKQMGKADLTFEELYKRTGRELCITAADMNTMDCIYCHVKTTPDMPIRQAVRMSGCIPGVFCPVQHQFGSYTDYCVDGGLLCNYPLHCFDGWYLCMDAKNSFLQKLKRLEYLPKLLDAKKRFGRKNEKTFGVLLYSGEEREVMKEDLRERFHKWITPSERQKYPDTELANKRKPKIEERERVTAKHDVLMEALNNFMNVLSECDIDYSGDISLAEFEMAMNKKNSKFTDKNKRRLFGEDFSDAKSLFEKLDTNADGKVTFRELTTFAERQALDLMEHFRSYYRQDINSLRGYFGAIMDTLLLNMKRIFLEGADKERTIGIDTGYIDTLDFKLDGKDQDYLIQQGKLGCVAFLRELIDEKKMTRET